MPLDVVLAIVCQAFVAVVLGVFAFKGLFRQLPVFFASMCFDLGVSGLGLAIYLLAKSPARYDLYGCFAYPIDLLCYFLILRELGIKILRFNREPRPQAVVGVLLFSAILLPFMGMTAWNTVPGRSLSWNVLCLEIRAYDLLTFAGVLALLMWSSLRRLRWPERELRIATGLACDTFVWFLIALLQARWNVGPVYAALYEAGQVADILMLAYWLHGFWAEPSRQAAVAEESARSRRNNTVFFNRRMSLKEAKG